MPWLRGPLASRRRPTSNARTCHLGAWQVACTDRVRVPTRVPRMTETLLRILLSELKTVRVRCKGKNGTCPMTYEIPIEELSSAFPYDQCPSCHQPFYGHSTGPALTT